MIAHLDFETRSRADLKAVGAHRYAIDPSTSVLMAAVSADDSDEVFLHVGHSFETPDLLDDPRALEILNRAELVYAHNVPFEQAVSWGRGFIVRPNKWRCTAALARKAGLPWSLEKCAEALGLEMRKDPEGAKLIKLFSIPQKDGSFANPKDYPDEWYHFGEYCKQDVRVEKAIHKKLKAFELTGAPLETFLFDLRMNQRGIPVNVPALLNAQKIIKDVDDSVTKEFVELTGYNPTQRGKVFQLVQSLGVPMFDMTADTVQWGIEEADSLTTYAAGNREEIAGFKKAHRILTLYAKLSFAAAKKVETMLECAWEGVVRGTFTYYGAGTGRWTAQKMQPQNFKKTPKWMRPITDEVYSRIEKGATMTELDVLYGEPLELIAGCIRHFIHAPGREMLDGDYNAIEARIICWLAGQHDILKMWVEGRDLYKFMASQIYGVSESAVDADQRDFGKRTELGCGYQMGPDKFFATCEQYGVPCDRALAETAVSVYRTTHPQVVKYWYYLNAQARAAIASPGMTQGPFSVKVLAGIPYLLFKLRSGRSLAYPHPKIEVLGGEDRDQITYWGQLPTALWGRVKLYGGKLAENETQATAADIMAHGAIEAERLGMAPFALIHDQALAIRENGKTAEEFAAALATVPAWAKGLPLKVEAKITPYYRK